MSDKERSDKLITTLKKVNNCLYIISTENDVDEIKFLINDLQETICLVLDAATEKP